MGDKDEGVIAFLKKLDRYDWFGFGIACVTVVLYGVLFGLSEELGLWKELDKMDQESLLIQIIIGAGILSFVVVFKFSWGISANILRKKFKSKGLEKEQ